MSSPLTAKIEAQLDKDAAQAVMEAAAVSPEATPPEGPVASTAAGRWIGRRLEWLAQRKGYRYAVELVRRRGDVQEALRTVPDRMHLVANQTELILDLAEDFRTGLYREIPWRSLAVGAGALLYIVSPIDVVPDILGTLGILDDLAVVALAARVIRSDLEAYCHFKGYPVDRYFGAEAA